MLANLFSFSLLLAAPLAALANPHGSAHFKRHVEVAKRQGGDVQLHKRFSDTRWSFYDVGLGACGKYNVESDFIVALNTPQYGGGYPGPNCFKTITMTYNGKTACPGCPYGGLDLSRSLFRFFAAESVGIIHGTWSFNDGSGAPPPPPPPPPKPTTKEWKPPTTWIPKPTTTWRPKPTTTWTPEPTPTWTPEPEPTTTKESSTSSSSSSSSSSSQASSTHSVISKSTSSSATPLATPSVTPENPQNLAVLNQGLLQLGVLIVAAA
ncbi:hypothetical protein D9615_001859 [Tricholomella constricta]|uniref:Uncharacterized protein n=1 Tax=Tricholomella constricta TaxID=117010 RepID=A0A8H5HNZ0_9AGAR|nr:hypothetical protein D9615_001859 [Tricholomella constricta]